MFKKRLFVFLFVCSVLCSGCDFSQNLSLDSGKSSVKVEIRDIADADLKKTAEGLAEVYATKPKNTGVSIAQNLNALEMKNLVGTGTDLNGFYETSGQKIGDDYFYILITKVDPNLEKFTIYKNKTEVFSFQSEPLSNYTPIISIRVIDNKYTVEYVEKNYSKSQNKFLENQRIWQDGIGEITAKYDLTNAIMPFEANGKMIFLGQKGAEWAIFYNGKMRSERFTNINFGYCCEPALYMPKAFNYRYLVFFATQDEKQKIVEVDVGSK